MNGEKLPEEKLTNILEAIRLSPSSLGLQPYKVIVVGDETMRKKIHETICTQPQIVEGSHLLVFAAREDMTVEEIDEFVNLTTAERNLSNESQKSLHRRISSFAQAKQARPEIFLNWTARQAYIALGFGLAAAAEQEVDATPMEGFKPDLMDEVLGLRKKGLRSVVLLMLGYRDAKNDYLVNLKKVRKPQEKLFIRI
jgi:nitroreductase